MALEIGIPVIDPYGSVFRLLRTLGLPFGMWRVDDAAEAANAPITLPVESSPPVVAKRRDPSRDHQTSRKNAPRATSLAVPSRARTDTTLGRLAPQQNCRSTVTNRSRRGCQAAASIVTSVACEVGRGGR